MTGETQRLTPPGQASPAGWPCSEQGSSNSVTAVHDVPAALCLQQGVRTCPTPGRAPLLCIPGQTKAYKDERELRLFWYPTQMTMFYLFQ